jgi:DNA-binding GntR family transcriptional regulator
MPATPLWRQLADEIRRGKLQSGRIIRSETTLMRTYMLARGGAGAR